MSKVHVLTADNNKNYRIVIHFPMPSGSNSVNKTWKSVLLAAGKSGQSVLSVGTNPSNITQFEMDSITAGDVVEMQSSILAESGGTSTASVNAMVDQIIADKKTELQTKYKYYGYTQ